MHGYSMLGWDQLVPGLFLWYHIVKMTSHAAGIVLPALMHGIPIGVLARWILLILCVLLKQRCLQWQPGDSHTGALFLDLLTPLKHDLLLRSFPKDGCIMCPVTDRIPG